MRANQRTQGQERTAEAAMADATGHAIAAAQAQGPLPVPESLSRVRKQLNLAQSSLFVGVQSPIRPTESDITRDNEYANVYYDGKSPSDFVHGEGKLFAIPVFDRKDLHSCLELLQAGFHLSSPEQVEALKSIIYKRAFGEFSRAEWEKLGRNDGLARENLSAEILGLVPTQRIDWAIAKVTSLNERAGIRVMLARKPGETGFIDPEVVPSGPVVFVKGDPVLDPNLETRHFRAKVEELLRVPEGSATSRATILLSDIHIKQTANQERDFLAALERLAERPPARLVIGGDIIDAKGFQGVCQRINEAIRQPTEYSSVLEKDEVDLFLSVVDSRRGSAVEGDLTIDESLVVRKQMIIDRMRLIRNKLPNTETSLLLGNHDMPRLETSLPMRSEALEKSRHLIGGVNLEIDKIPTIKLEKGQLPPAWLATFRSDLSEVLHAHGASEDVVEKIGLLNDAQMVRIARIFYPIKGERLEDLHTFHYYDENWASEVQRELRGLGITTLNKRSDKYYEVELGTAEKPQRGLLSHQPLESGVNLNRVIREKPLISGGQTTWPSGTRFVVAFDQHAACSVIMDRDGSSVSVHQVGSLTPHSNPGQRFMCAVMDPDTGSLFHLTFDDGSGALSGLRLADYRQLQYILPTVNPQAPASLASTTGKVVQ